MDKQSNTSARDKIALLRGVRQVRQFSAEPVPPAVLTDILEVARWTGSGMNQQPWEFVVVHDPATLRALSQGADAQAHVARANVAIVVVMTETTPEITAYDEGRLSERILAAAAAHGVAGGIWWFKDGGETAKRLLGIPADRRVRTAISLGYPAPPAPDAPPKRTDSRKPLTELVHEEHY